MSLRYQYYMSTASIHGFSLCNEFTVTIFGSNMVGARSTLPPAKSSETNVAPEFLGLEDVISFWECITRWWFQISFNFHHKQLGKDSQFDTFFKWLETIN